jgi:trehalose 6-phosphate synthase/phosphatase
MLYMHHVLLRYKHSSKRIMLTDLEGTFWMCPKPSAPADSEDMSLERALEVLRRLSADCRNDVWLLSGLPIDGVLAGIGLTPRRTSPASAP